MSVGWAHSRLYSILVGGASILLSRIVSPEAFSTVRPDALEHIASELNLYLIVSRFSKLGVADAVGQMHDVLLFLLHFKAVVDFTSPHHYVLSGVCGHIYFTHLLHQTTPGAVTM